MKTIKLKCPPLNPCPTNTQDVFDIDIDYQQTNSASALKQAIRTSKVECKRVLSASAFNSTQKPLVFLLPRYVSHTRSISYFYIAMLAKVDFKTLSKKELEDHHRVRESLDIASLSLFMSLYSHHVCMLNHPYSWHETWNMNQGFPRACVCQ